MSKLDNIVLDCINKALDQKEEKLGDYVDPTKEQIKALMLELIGEDKAVPRPLDEESRAKFYRVSGQNFTKSELRKKVADL
jgi:hypothetical protein